MQNLSRSFPDKNYQEIERTMKSFYYSFSDNLVEILKSTSISPNKQAEKIKLKNFDIIDKQISQGKSIIVCLGHCGNWEILNILPHLIGHNCYAIYKPLKIEVINKLFLKIRSRFGMQLIPTKSIVRHFISHKHNPSVYFFLADQCPKSTKGNYRFNFLHQQTNTFYGVERLAQSSNSAVVYIHITKTSRGVYQVECRDICTDSTYTAKKEITQKYIHFLEENIYQQPSGWLWTHKRWKR